MLAKPVHGELLNWAKIGCFRVYDVTLLPNGPLTFEFLEYC